MVKRKKSSGGGANWMDTYGDMVTLLLCFFVLLYSMSTISEEKWKAIVTSFNPFAVQTPTDPEGNGGPIADPNLGDTGVNEPDSNQLAEQSEIDNDIRQLYEALQEMVAQEGMENTVQVTMQGGKVYVSFSDTVMFAADRAVILPEGQEVLSEVCDILETASKSIDEIRVQGHTAQARPDQVNEPRGDYRLAANRAMEVSLFIQENTSIAPARMIQESFGQWRPRSSNATAETRAANRRVEMIISGRDLDAVEFNEAMQHYLDIANEGLTTTNAQNQ